MTSTAVRGGTEHRPLWRMFTVEVARVQRLCPNFVRLTFTGEHLDTFGAGGADQRIKLALPQPGRTVADVPDGEDWYQRWLAMPDPIRPVLRTYTVRAFRPEHRELDVDFVLHGLDSGHGGPASTFAAGARPGDVIALLGPDRPGSGRPWGCEWAPPSEASRLVLAGDETAVPAIGSILEALPADARGIACLEVPSPADRQEWAVPAGVDVRWLARGGAPHGALLEPAVGGALDELRTRGTGTAVLDDVDVDTTALWEVPERGEPGADDLYGWLAGEAAVIKRLRRLLVNDYGIPRGSVAFMGYWREGRS
ncbi:siderophore-interacting protein [Saccharopolyspora sp. CA-218241]|uniref:siderophore-interacting protein n=1 Tax=Saccharopolyspora sp. CA-218241 TaxID=3240027 RepID=UPI003D973581